MRIGCHFDESGVTKKVRTRSFPPKKHPNGRLWAKYPYLKVGVLGRKAGVFVTTLKCGGKPRTNGPFGQVTASWRCLTPENATSGCLKSGQIYTPTHLKVRFAHVLGESCLPQMPDLGEVYLPQIADIRNKTMNSVRRFCVLAPTHTHLTAPQQRAYSPLAPAKSGAGIITPQ